MGLTLIQPEDAAGVGTQAIYTLKRGDKTAAQALLLPQIDVALLPVALRAIIGGVYLKFRFIVAGHERAICARWMTRQRRWCARRFVGMSPADTRVSWTGEQRLPLQVLASAVSKLTQVAPNARYLTHAVQR